jgi:hypothetical protein
MRCSGTELSPRIVHMNTLLHEIARRFLVLGTPMSSHFLLACALSTSFLVGLLITCIVSGTSQFLPPVAEKSSAHNY